MSNVSRKHRPRCLGLLVWNSICIVLATLPRPAQCTILWHMGGAGGIERPRGVASGMLLGIVQVHCSTINTAVIPLQASQLLRMTHVWAQTTVAVEETTSGLGLLCRLYLCIALGLLQPWFLFLALLLCRHGIRYGDVLGDNRWHVVVPTPTYCSTALKSRARARVGRVLSWVGCVEVANQNTNAANRQHHHLAMVGLRPRAPTPPMGGS